MNKKEINWKEWPEATHYNTLSGLFYKITLNDVVVFDTEGNACPSCFLVAEALTNKFMVAKKSWITRCIRKIKRWLHGTI